MAKSKSLTFHEQFDYLAVPKRDVQEGDLLANHGTVTAVITGSHKGKDEWETVKADETLIRCGPGFSIKAKSTSAIVIGRRRG